MAFSRLFALLILVGPALAGCLLAAPLTGQPATPDGPGQPMVRFTTVDSGHWGAEPTIGIAPSGSIFMTAMDKVLRSRDGGYNWEEVIDFGLTDDPATDIMNTADPMLWVDTVTGRILVPQMFPGVACSHFLWSDDDGDSWLQRPLDCPTPGSDHPKIVTGNYPAGMELAGAIYPQATYYCYNKGYTTQCATSFDGGLSYAYDRTIAVDPIDGCGGLNGHPAVAPDGTVYLPFHRHGYITGVTGGTWQNCDAPRVAVSTDAGLTWTIQKSPATTGVQGLEGDLAVSPDGTAYLLYQGGDMRQYLSRSSDQFQTWEGPWLVSAQGLQSTAFSAITTGDDGRIAIAYYGTRDTNAHPEQAPDDARWHLYAGTSTDAGETFEDYQLTPDEDPIQVGCIWLSGGDVPCRNHLDFIDLHATPDGRPYIAYTDGCMDGCAGNPDATGNDSRDWQIHVAFLEQGQGLQAGTQLLAPS